MPVAWKEPIHKNFIGSPHADQKDLQLILKRNRRTAGYSGGGTNFDGPDGSSYSKMGPIQAAINHFQEVSQAKTKVLIMVTDGESNISEARFNELLDQLKKANIRVYTLGVGEGWVGASSQTTDLRRLTESSGGKVMVVGDASQMKAGFEALHQSDQWLLLLAASATGFVGLGLQTLGYQRVESASRAAVLSVLEIPFAYMLQGLLFHEGLEPLGIAGTALVTGASLLNLCVGRPRARTKKRESIRASKGVKF